MNESSQGLGKGMIYAAWLLALGLLTLFFNHFLDKENNPNQELTTRAYQDGSHEVILQRNRNGHYVASGTINGKPVVFFWTRGRQSSQFLSILQTLSICNEVYHDFQVRQMGQ
ncbi:MAG: hypothetical protein VSS75_007475 [Candidatus Parabeggiatoa sp.]|nr:hypothetical protein [Candidatus Parabeggiatoa sp.]